MPPIVMIASLRAKAGREGDLLAALTEAVTQTHEEDGCERYAVLQAQDEPTRIAIVEKWRDEVAFGAHASSPHLAELGALLQELLAEPPSGTAFSELGLGSEVLGRL